MEAKKDIIADAGMELTDEELEGGAGGSYKLYYYDVYCRGCGCGMIKIASNIRYNDAMKFMAQHERPEIRHECYIKQIHE